MILVAVLSLATLVVVDDLGRVVSLDKIPEKIVSAAPAATRYLIQLGLQDKVVGVTDWDPLEGPERIGNMVPLNVEKIVSLSPDLVLTFGGFQAGEVKKLEKFGIKVLALNPTTLKDILKDLVLLGTVMGVEDLAKSKAEKLENLMLSIAKDSYKIPLEKRPKVLYLMGTPESGMKEFWTAVSGSYMNELINLAGGRNIAADVIGPNGWAPISLEFIVERNPDVIIVANFTPGGEKNVIQKVMDFEPFAGLNAVKNKRVHTVDGNVASQPSPDLFGILQKLHEIFKGEE